MEDVSGCVGAGCGLGLVFAIAVAIEAFVIKLAWNYVLVDTAGVDVNHITFKAAVIVALVLSVVGSSFSHSTTVKK